MVFQDFVIHGISILQPRFTKSITCIVTLYDTICPSIKYTVVKRIQIKWSEYSMT